MFIRNQHMMMMKIHVKLFILQGELHGWKKIPYFNIREKNLRIFICTLEKSQLKITH